MLGFHDDVLPFDVNTLMREWTQAKTIKRDHWKVQTLYFIIFFQHKAIGGQTITINTCIENNASQSKGNAAHRTKELGKRNRVQQVGGGHY